MSEHEFEAYLNLLARTLRLSAKQRQRIAGELRDHMEQRLDELTADGVPRHDAALQALDEFGDANVLAHELTDSAKLKHRRRLMQTTFATAAIAALAVMFFAPTNFQGVPAQPAAVAQDATPPVENVEAIDVHFDQTPISEVFAFFSEQLGVNLHVNWFDLDEAGLGPDEPVTMDLEAVDPFVAFELLLRTAYPDATPLAAEALDDNVWLITRADRIKRELTTRGHDLTRFLELRRSELLPERYAQPGGYGGGYGGFGGGSPAPQEDVGALADVIRDSIGADQWALPGAGVTVFDGLVIIRQTRENQREIEHTLEYLANMLEDRGAKLRAEAEARATRGAMPRAYAQYAQTTPQAKADAPQPGVVYGMGGGNGGGGYGMGTEGGYGGGMEAGAMGMGGFDGGMNRGGVGTSGATLRGTGEVSVTQDPDTGQSVIQADEITVTLPNTESSPSETRR